MHRSIAEWCVPLVFGAALCAGVVDLQLAESVPGRPVTVVYPPWTSRSSGIEKATRGARLVQLGWFPFALTVLPEMPGYREYALRGGAWFVGSFKPLMFCQAVKP